MKLLIQIIQWIPICILMHLYICEPFTPMCNNCQYFPSDELREIRYEYFKNFILKKMQLSKAPVINLPKLPRKSLLALAEMTQNPPILDTNEEQKTIILYPDNENLICENNESTFCSRLSFNVSEKLYNENFLSAEFWLYKPYNQYIRVHQIITNLPHNQINNLELKNFAKDTEVWGKYKVFKRDSNAITVTVTDESQNHADVVAFLIIRSKIPVLSSRTKRSITCTAERNTSCCKENFFLNFTEIGWDDWLIVPGGYQANFCRGHCLNDLSKYRFFHGSVVQSYIRDNKYTAEEIGLSMCCTPSEMAPLQIIYRDEKGDIFHKIIANMTVVTCECA